MRDAGQAEALRAEAEALAADKAGLAERLAGAKARLEELGAARHKAEQAVSGSAGGGGALGRGHCPALWMLLKGTRWSGVSDTGQAPGRE